MNRSDKFDEAFANSLGYKSYERQSSAKFTQQYKVSKVKARDIVDGWPRGRSTSSYRLWEVSEMDIKCRDIRMLNKLMFTNDPAEYYDIMQSEMQYTNDINYAKLYHQEQQRMTDEFIRLGKPMKATESIGKFKYATSRSASIFDYDYAEERGARMK